MKSSRRWLWPWELSKLGLLGINARNNQFIQGYNPRSMFPRVDDKLLSKKLAIEAGLHTPKLYSTVEFHYQARDFHRSVAEHESFVVKPARGAGGNGVVVIVGRDAKGDYLRTSGKLFTRIQMERYLANVLSGLHSLGGSPDKAIVEYRVKTGEPFTSLSYQGVPDIRVLVFQGYPVMAMLRLSTSASGGRANLHQGAIGVGLDIATGQAVQATCRDQLIETHPDTGQSLRAVRVPNWEALLLLAARCYEISGMGYLGVDIVVDADRGPLVLELNARPGLSIQLANGEGLLPRLRRIQREATGVFPRPYPERVQFSREAFGKRNNHEALSPELMSV